MKTSTEELLAFVTVVDCGSITAAAVQLAQTTSGISRALARLEQKLETTLLSRTTRRLELSEEGALFLVHARRIIAAIDEAEESLLVRHQNPSGRLRVDAASPFVLHVLVPLIGSFRAAYPAIELELTSNDQFIDLLERRTDVAIRIGPLQDSTLHARALGQTRLRIYAAPEYLQRHGTPQSPQELAQHSLLGFVAPSTLNIWPLLHAGGPGLAITPTLSASSGESLRQMALQGLGLICLAEFMTRADCAAGRLVEVLAEHTPPTYQPIHAVYYQNTQLSARIRCLLDFLLDKLPGRL
ncbi:MULTISPECIES: LysR family transcriptional regulator [Gammaproteobacteria]|uniref:LysR family transcriptional regulator n=1 Tax=Gammaproteobacteria TaxID=1236 RepID=UPI001C6334FF|nr:MULTISPECIES: LysR family transcriptional regulator [Gammaproteobacteria]MEE1978937.1 LysR family transcriptional regulator [Shewanella xiamenensis]QYH28448.1 LysR family transcriptional regulator [Aeromonas salmonicida subsp. masoucida]QYH32766.1 LysR family transcriptional regulator [Aeromonas salmonicida subsp. masoucida]